MTSSLDLDDHFRFQNLLKYGNRKKNSMIRKKSEFLKLLKFVSHCDSPTLTCCTLIRR